MILRGRIENGKIVLDLPLNLEEGAKVEIVVVSPITPEAEQTAPKSPLSRLAGMAKGLPENASTTIDQVLYGTQAGFTILL